MTQAQRQSCTLPDGRQLSYLVYGQPLQPLTRPSVLFIHGIPASAREGESLGVHAQEAGVTLVSVDRPGMGGSSPNPNLSLASFAKDLGALMDHLGLQCAAAVVGESGGGPYAAAAAAVLGPERVHQLHLLAAVGPVHGKQHSQLLSSLNFFDRLSFRWVRWRALRPLAWSLHRITKWVVTKHPATIKQHAAEDLGPADADCLDASPALSEMLVAFMAGAYEQGVGGVLRDYWVLGGPWTGVDPGSIKCKTTVWHGQLDKCVPASHSEWYAAHIPGSTLRLLEGEGHITISARRGKEVLDVVVKG